MTIICVQCDWERTSINLPEHYYSQCPECFIMVCDDHPHNSLAKCSRAANELNNRIQNEIEIQKEAAVFEEHFGTYFEWDGCRDRFCDLPNIRCLACDDDFVCIYFNRHKKRKSHQKKVVAYEAKLREAEKQLKRQKEIDDLIALKEHD